MITPSSSIKRAHFIGIGGAGMSGIALVLHERGCFVSGSDLKMSSYVRGLQNAGIDVHIGHHAQTIDEVAPEVVVISSAIPATNSEVVRARELNIPVWPRAKMLSYLSHHAITVAVAGTHGKTTTSSMVATMLDHVGKDPSFLIGGIVEEYKTNGKNGNGGYFVCEADESDGSFLYLHPNVVVITNIEADHLDHYKTMDNLEHTFCEFMDLVGDAGTIIVCGENPHCVELARSTHRRVITYGFDESCDYVCKQTVQTHKIRNNFDISVPDGSQYSISLPANPGKHNVLNATAALAVADVLGINLQNAAQALSNFKGAHRRFTHVGDIDDICVVDDYGHHPTEIKATLEAAKNLQFNRVVCVFQPHRYSRTQNLQDEFAHAFENADVLIVTEVFSAGETPIPGVNGMMLAEKIQASTKHCDVTFVSQKKDVVAHLLSIARPHDLIITQGAGDVTVIGPAFIKAKQEQDANGK